MLTLSTQKRWSVPQSAIVAGLSTGSKPRDRHAGNASCHCTVKEETICQSLFVQLMLTPGQ